MFRVLANAGFLSFPHSLFPLDIHLFYKKAAVSEVCLAVWRWTMIMIMMTMTYLCLLFYVKWTGRVKTKRGQGKGLQVDKSRMIRTILCLSLTINRQICITASRVLSYPWANRYHGISADIPFSPSSAKCKHFELRTQKNYVRLICNDSTHMIAKAHCSYKFVIP